MQYLSELNQPRLNAKDIMDIETRGQSVGAVVIIECIAAQATIDRIPVP